MAETIEINATTPDGTAYLGWYYLAADYDALAARLAEAEHDMDQLIGERDHAEGMADKLADAVATLLGVEIGEHSNMNCPWTEALEAFEERAMDSAEAAPCAHEWQYRGVCKKCAVYDKSHDQRRRDYKRATPTVSGEQK